MRDIFKRKGFAKLIYQDYRWREIYGNISHVIYRSIQFKVLKRHNVERPPGFGATLCGMKCEKQSDRKQFLGSPSDRIALK